MRRRDIQPKRQNQESGDQAAGYLENVRFFKFLPHDVEEKLTVEQKRAIAQTILDLQLNNPRILQEIYLEQPDRVGKRPSILSRFKRRIVYASRYIWLALVLQQGERRRSTSISDYVFLLIVVVLVFTLLFIAIFILYYLKSLAGIDIVPGVHFFYSE